MKRFSILIFSFLICGALIGGLWYVLLPRGKHNVQKIYSVPHFEQKSVKQTQVKRSETSETFSATNKIESSDEATRDDIRSLFTELGFSSEDESAFWEWLAKEYYKDDSSGSPNNQHQDMLGVSTGAISRKYSYVELSKLVRDAYDLGIVLNMYGINRIQGQGICPICSDHTFSTPIDGKSGKRDFWRCSNCTIGPKRFIDFVVRMEGISRYEAYKYLAELADLLK